MNAIIQQKNRTFFSTGLDSGLCLGGLGCGGVELWADGIFRHHAYMSTAPWNGWRHQIPPQGESQPLAEPNTGVEDLCFVLRVQRPGRAPQLRFLFVGQGGAWLVGEHMSRTYKYATIPTVRAIEHTAEFPFTRLKYLDPSLPVQVELLAWSPFIPHDHLASSTPGAVFDFTITSQTGEPLTVSLLQITSNLAGFDQTPDYAPEHSLETTPAGVIIRMKGGRDPHSPATGEMGVFAAVRAGQSISAVSHNPYLQNLYYSFYATGHLDGPRIPPRIAREEYHFAAQNAPMFRDQSFVSVQTSLQPGESAHIRAGLTWYFPNHYDRFGVYVGKFYETRFADSGQVAAYLLNEADALQARSRAWTDSILDSDLDSALALALLDQANTLVKSSWYSKDGRFFLWEGLGQGGMNTVDVEHYGSFGVAFLFPALRASALDLIQAAQRPNGQVAHAYQRNIRPEDMPDGEYHRWDVNLQYLLAFFRDWRWSGDFDLLRRHWQSARRALTFVQSLDRLGIGLPFTEGGITYDHWHMVGVVAYMSGLYLAALQAAKTMAEALGDTDFAADCQTRWETGRASFERLFWQGGYYKALVREGEAAGGQDARLNLLAAKPIDLGLHTDALNGEAFALLTGLPRALDPQRVQTMLRAILTYNLNEDGRFLANGSCPNGEFPDEWPFSQWQNPWTGTEYFFAAQLLSEGMEEEALGILRNVFDRLDESGMRFRHNECGDFYTRALAIYAAWQAWLGLLVDVPARSLRLKPTARQTALRSPFLCGTGWGRMTIRRGHHDFSLEISLTEGRLTLESVELPLAAAPAASLNGQPLEAYPSEGRIRFRQPIRLAPGDHLTLIVHAHLPETAPAAVTPLSS
jgi:uncharacterized protein (DUF608 family)